MSVEDILLYPGLHLPSPASGSLLAIPPCYPAAVLRASVLRPCPGSHLASGILRCLLYKLGMQVVLTF